MQAYENLFGGSKGRVDLGAPSTTPTTGTSPIVSTTGVNVGTPGTATAPKPVPLPGVPGATFTPGQPQFFGNVPGAMLPGTLPSNINPMQSYKGPMVGQMLANNPNLSPTVLGGAQGLGYYTDRLGNRILSPGGALMRFAEGGEADKDDSAKAELEKLLASMPAQEKTEVRVSPNARSVKRTTTKSAATDRGKAMSMSLESLAAGKGSGSTDQGSAAEQLAALMEQVKGKKEDVNNLARKNLTRSTLDRAGPLVARRFAKGGESVAPGIAMALQQFLERAPAQVRTYAESVRDPRKQRAPLTEGSFSAQELAKLRELIAIAEKNPVLSEKTGKPLPGVVDYAHHREQIRRRNPKTGMPLAMLDSDLNMSESGNLRNTLGQFVYERLPDGTLVVKDRYDYTGDVAEKTNPLVKYATYKGVDRPVNITLPPEVKRKK
jgi:hypothetical protein